MPAKTIDFVPTKHLIEARYNQIASINWESCAEVLNRVAAKEVLERGGENLLQGGGMSAGKPDGYGFLLSRLKRGTPALSWISSDRTDLKFDR